MAFEYYGANTPLQGLDYSPITEGPEQVQQQPQQQMDPTQIMSMVQGMMGGGGAQLAGPAGSGGTSGLSKVGVVGGSGGGGGATGGFGSAMSAAGPWAALAAIIVGNELYAKKRGYRSEDSTDYIKDLFSGEVFHQDIEQRFLPKLGIDEGSKTSKAISFALNPSPVNFGEQWDRLKDIF